MGCSRVGTISVAFEQLMHYAALANGLKLN